MTGFVLALAGLACGDAGPGMGAARGPVAVCFDGEWEGELFTSPSKDATVRVGRGKIVLKYPDLPDEFPGPLRFVPVGEGKLLLVPGPNAPVMNAIYKVESGRVIVCYAPEQGRWPKSFGRGTTGGYLFILKPAAPRKP